MLFYASRTGKSILGLSYFALIDNGKRFYSFDRIGLIRAEWHRSVVLSNRLTPEPRLLVTRQTGFLRLTCQESANAKAVNRDYRDRFDRCRNSRGGFVSNLCDSKRAEVIAKR